MVTLLTGLLGNNSRLLPVWALLFVVPFFYPQFFSWMVFIFFVPIFYYALTQKIGFLTGFYWGIIFYFFHLLALFVCIYEYGAGCMRMLAPVALVGYFALYSGLWFFCLGKLKHIFDHWLWHGPCFTMLTFLYIWFMYEGVFWVFESWYGYCFTHPLLPLAQQPEWLFFIHKFGIWTLTICLIGVQFFLARFLVTRKRLFVVGAFFSFCPFLLGWFIKQTNKKPVWHARVGCIGRPKIQSHDSYKYAFAINNQIEQYLIYHPATQIIIMPESAFPFVLNECPKTVDLWEQNCLADGIHLLIGATRSDGDKKYNCLFHLHRGRIINFYDKSHLFWFIEHTNFKNKILRFFAHLFWRTDDTYSRGTSVPPTIRCAKFECKPQICSDLFLGHARDVLTKNKREIPIVCIANDQWFSLSYARNLMQLYAKFFGLAHGQIIFAV